MKSIKFTFKILSLFFLFSETFAADYVGIKPQFLFGQWDKLTETVNLTPTDDQGAITIDQYKNGFQITTCRKIYISTGVASDFSQAISENQYAWGSIGLYPVLNSYACFVNHVATQIEADKIHNVIPSSIKILETWTDGDRVNYQTLGGIVFTANTGLSRINAGFKVVFEGGWAYYVEKKNSSEIYVEVSKVFSRSLSAIIGGPLFSYLEAGKMAADVNGFAFLVKIDTEKGADVYKDLIHGRIDRAEENPDVAKKILTLEAYKRNKIYSANIGTPFVPVILFSASKEIQNHSEKRTNIWNRQFETNYVLSLKKRQINIFNYKKIVSTAFLVTQKEERQLDENNILTLSSTSFLESQLYWINKTTSVNSEGLSSMLAKLKVLTGLDKFIDFKVPHEDHLRYSQIQLSLKFSQELNMIIKNNPERLRSYISNEADKNLCERDLKGNFLTKKDENGFEYNECFDFEKMLIAIKKTDKTNNRFVKIGQNFWNSSRLFQLALNLAKTCGGELAYEVSGRRISLIQKIETYTMNKDLCPIN